MRNPGLQLIFLICAMALGEHPAMAQPASVRAAAGDQSQICHLIGSTARTYGLPIAFFVRLIWQESRFRPDEIGPLTTSGEHALGIAQFMPGTAIERGLFAPFDPAAALPKSGELLAELRTQFGNLGLAAAAYNAGPQRVRNYIAGLRDLPDETQNYVLAITGHPVGDWMQSSAKKLDEEFAAGSDSNVASCPKLMAELARSSNSSIAEFELKVPHWCRYLEHPNVSICGPVHQGTSTIHSLRQLSVKGRKLMLIRSQASALGSANITGLR